VWSSATFLLVRLLGEAIRRECNNGWAAMTVCLLSKEEEKAKAFSCFNPRPAEAREKR
jgi:hypothetical protein